MSPVRLKEYEWLFNSVTPDKTTLVYHHGFTAQCIMSLVGPAAFCGTFYPEVLATQSLHAEKTVFSYCSTPMLQMLTSKSSGENIAHFF